MIFKITKKWAREARAAVRATIKRYENGIDHSFGCPFCKNYVMDEFCDRCPWVAFKKKKCFEFHYENDPIFLRLRRLRGWEKRLTNIIKRKE